MSKADELFEKLGYTETEKYKNGIDYKEFLKSYIKEWLDE